MQESEEKKIAREILGHLHWTKIFSEANWMGVIVILKGDKLYAIVK